MQVARCTKIINPNTDEAKYVINVKQIAKFVVGLGDKVRRDAVRCGPVRQPPAKACMDRITGLICSRSGFGC